MKLGYINSARGIAILMVVLVHTSQLLSFKNNFLKLFFDYSQMGVQLFFIASAYTLCLTQNKRDREKDNNGNFDFYVRRLFRIFPIYYLGILIYFLLNYYFKDAASYTLKNILSNIFFIHGLVPSANNTIVPGGWSIGTEMLFYLIFPFLYKFLFSGKILIKGFLIIVASLAAASIIAPHIFNNSFWYFNILVQLPVFIIGMFFFYFESKLKISTLNGGGVIFFLFTGLSMVIWHFQLFIFVPLLSGISFCGLLIILRLSRLNNVIFQKIGILSYSIYITHFIFVFYIFHKLTSISQMLIIFLFTICMSYIVGIILEKYIEKPFIKMGSQLINSLRHK